MQSPENSTEKAPLPSSLGVVELPNDLHSPTDTISQLSQASSRGRASLSSPLGAKDIGVPKTPPQRVITPVDDDLLEEGYDTDGLRPPWEEAEVLDFDGPEVNEEPLRVGPPPISPQVPDRQNFAENLASVVDVPKMNVSQLKEQLKMRGCSVRGKKTELQERLIKAIEEKVPLVQNLTAEKVSNMAGDAFSPGAHWEILRV